MRPKISYLQYVHELTYTEIVNSGTIRLMPWRCSNRFLSNKNAVYCKHSQQAAVIQYTVRKPSGK